MNQPRQSQSIKTNHKVLTTGHKAFIGLIGAIILLCFIAPYLHIEMSKTSKVKVFGFRNLRSFMFSFGLPLSLFACSSILICATKYINDATPKKVFSGLGFLFCYTGIFHFIWIFWAKTDLSRHQYYLAITVISIVFVFIFRIFYKYHESSIERLKKVIKKTFTYIYESIDDLKPEKKTEHKVKRGKLISETLEDVK